MDYLWAAILGLVQGLTEFLPVSSSGHLALAGHLGMGSAGNPAFDVFLHVATLCVVLLFFRQAIQWYFRNDRIVLLYVLIASIPTAVVGFAFKSSFEALRQSPMMICTGLLVTAAALAFAEMTATGTSRLQDMGWFGAFFIGLCQTLAITPGISRSGLTLAGALSCGIEREEAFRFSFILSIPAVGGAALLKGIEFIREPGATPVAYGPAIVGFLVAAISGYAALSFLRRIVIAGRLVYFAGYCCLIALLGLAYFGFFR